MTARPIHPGLKTALELGPVIGFFVAYLWVKDEVFVIGGVEYTGFVVATAGFIPVILAAMAVLWKLTGRLSRMQALTAVLVIVLGGLTVWLNDERFLKIKPTIVYGLFAALLGLGLLLGRSWLQLVMEELLPMTDEGWAILTRRVTAMFAALAVANELVWRTQSTETWVWFETFGLPIATFAFFMSQAGLFNRYGIDASDGKTSGGDEAGRRS